MNGDPREYVVLTYFLDRDGGNAITHAYGPYSRSQARIFRAQMLDEYSDVAGTLHVSVNRMLNYPMASNETELGTLVGEDLKEML